MSNFSSRFTYPINSNFSTLALLSFLPAFMLGCDATPPEAAPGITIQTVRSAQPAKQQDQNCLLIVLDAARARSFKPWGYSRDTTPRITAFARESLVFTKAISQAPETVPSVWSYFSGFYPHRISIRYWYAGFNEGDYNLPVAFQLRGYSTAAFSENPFVSQNFGHDIGFDRFKEYTRFIKSDNEWLDVNPTHSKDMVTEIVDWLETIGDSPWFAYVHMLRPHSPYVAPGPYQNKFVDDYQHSVNGSGKSVLSVRYTATPEEAKHLNDLYDGNLAYADSLVETILVALKENDHYVDTWIVIASDHGEAFMEHGQLAHGRDVYDELVHVPLMIRPPDSTHFEPRKISTLVELVDLFPTFVDIFGLNPPASGDGMSLLPLMQDDSVPHKKFAFSYAWGSGTVAIRSSTDKFILHLDKHYTSVEKTEFYDLEQDPLEQADLRKSPADATHRIDLAMKYVRRQRQSTVLNEVEISEERRKQLEAAGYLR